MELLVAAALAAVVAAAVLPVFVEAKGAANESRCTMNLKQIGSALQMYRDDWGTSVLRDAAPRPWGQGGWMEKAYTYHRNMSVYRCPSRDADFAYSLNERLADAYTARPVKPSILICAFDAPGSILDSAGPETDASWTRGDANLCNAGGGVNQRDAAVRASRSEYSDREDYDRRLWRDAQETPYHGWLLFPGPHAGGSNILFYDGHVRKFLDWRLGSMTFDPRSNGYS